MSTMGFSGLTLADQRKNLALKDKSVVWLWLGGGPTQFETFHAPTDFSVPDQFRPVNGLMYDSDTNLCFGADWLETFKHKDKLVSVNSFTHGDSSHRQATHWMMTGHYNGERAQTSLAQVSGHSVPSSLPYTDRTVAPEFRRMFSRVVSQATVLHG